MFPKNQFQLFLKKELFSEQCLGRMSPNLKQKLRSCFKNSLPQSNIKIILKLTNHPSFSFQFKDVIPEELQSRI